MNVSRSLILRTKITTTEVLLLELLSLPPLHPFIHQTDDVYMMFTSHLEIYVVDVIL